jgi:TatD DNase family protein
VAAPFLGKPSVNLFDSHCHLTDERFAGEVEAVLARALSAAVARVVTVASSARDALAALHLARQGRGLWCTAGIHPHEAASADEAARATVAELATEPEVVAIGETGLDYHYEHSPRAVQRAVLDWHLELAAEVRRPVVVHCREADADLIAILRASPGVAGVLHCFSGGAALLEAGLEAGWYISFAGMVSFRNYAGADLVRAVPLNRLLLETDSPYLAPVPQRGRRNEPGFLPHIAQAVAALRGAPLDEVAVATFSNASRFYGLES